MIQYLQHIAFCYIWETGVYFFRNIIKKVHLSPVYHVCFISDGAQFPFNDEMVGRDGLNRDSAIIGGKNPAATAICIFAMCLPVM